MVLARLKLAQGDVAGAAVLLAEADRSVRQQNLMHRLPEVATAQVLTLLRQGSLSAAAHLAQTHELPLSKALVHLAQGDLSAALVVLLPWRQQVEAKGWEDERLKVMVLQAAALEAYGDKDQAVHLLLDVLMLAEPGGFIRTFVDEGLPMAHLLSETAAHGRMPDSIGKLLAIFKAEDQKREATSSLPPPTQSLIEPLSRREVEVLQLIAQGLSNQEISERLVLSLETVKGHNKKIFGKLQVQRRTEAYDLIYDAVGNRSVSDYKRALNSNGTCVIAGFQNLPRLFEHVVLGPLRSKTGNKKVGLMRTAKMNQKDLVYMKELLEAGKVVPVIDRRYPLSETAEARQYLEEGHARGKVVITVDLNDNTSL